MISFFYDVLNVTLLWTIILLINVKNYIFVAQVHCMTVMKLKIAILILMIMVFYHQKYIKCSDIMCLKFGKFGKYICCTNLFCENICRILHNGIVVSF